MEEMNEQEQNNPRAIFKAHGMEWLYDHANIIIYLGADARAAQFDELAQRLRDRGLSPEDSRAWAQWAVAVVGAATVDKHIGLLMT
jgi:hypothetical protein